MTVLPIHSYSPDDEPAVIRPSTMPAHSLYFIRRLQRERIRRVILGMILVLALLLTLLVSFTLGYYFSSPARRVPSLEAVLAMSDGEAAEALSDFTEAHLTEAWGEPLSAYDMEFDVYGRCRYLLYKSPHSLDHLELFIPLQETRIAYAEVWQVFRAYPVHISREGEWATVTPCPLEAETAYGDLIVINLATSRPAVLDSLDPHIPVIIYYKGTPSLTDGQRIPRITTVEEMHFYDKRLEPLERLERDE